ncbi:enoyl-CoA hydratase/isomerase family protein [Streptomyces sp. NBC_01210]|uniref:enoyl-CoA hydratase/isomerase family protein n=1 Tax=Streptomyces sp. NBC_01210 TaxID=2903774 RepID=UPI002E0D22AD|nr:enoyl-CoA hydratase/isomerase family protein [Streptomyces sp. NBC_01210]
MTGAPDELVLAEHRGPVLVLTNRHAKLNAWTDELENRYFTLLDAAEDDPDVRAVEVTGTGRGFCAGADLQRLQAADEHKRSPIFPSLPVRSSDVPV